MPLKTVCRLCLAMDVSVHNIIDSPLQGVYEKLTDISLNTAPRPAMACYLCYSQLRKSHNLMVRSVRADEVLTQILRGGELGNVEIIAGKIREMQQMNELGVTPVKLAVTPVKLAVIPGPEQKPANKNVKEEPLSPQRDDEINTGVRRCADYLNFEESEYEEDIDRVVLRDVANVENDVDVVEEKIKKRLGDEVDIESDVLTVLRDIKQEKLEVTETNWGKCISYFMFEDSEGIGDNGRNDLSKLIREEDRSHGEQVTSICMNILKFENSEHGEIEQDTENMEVTGIASAEECKEIHGTSPTYRHNVLEKRRTRGTIIKEETNRGFDSISRSTKNPANNRQVSINTSVYSDTVRKNSVVGMNNDCATSNRDMENRNSQSNKMFVCNDCGSVFDDRYILIEHLERHNVVKKESRENVHQHMTLRKLKRKRTGNVIRNVETQTAEIDFECKICLRRLNNKNALQKRSIAHTAEKPYECEICKMKLRWKSDLKRHVATHTGEKHFACHICNARFIRNTQLKGHLLTHTDEKPFECEVCKVRFRTKYHLKNHHILHTGEKPFECDICKVRFRRKRDLNQHTRTHTGEKHFECDVCKIRFSQSGHLKIHSAIHTGQKRFQCDICKMRFIRNEHLRRHSMTHTDEKPFECDICRARFREKGPLKKHLMTHTGEKPFKCTICKLMFRRKCNLRTHFISHTGEKPFQCDICKLRLTTNGGLKRHLMIHTGEKPFECEICKFRFIDKGHLKRHLATHTGQKPYKCDICEVRFSRKLHLSSHLITHSAE